MKILKRLLPALLISTYAMTVLGSLPAKVFAPYVDTSLYPTFSVTGTYNQTGQKYYMLAFVLADSQNQPSWNGVTPINQNFMLSDIQSLRAAGGDVGVSFGGANGTPLAAAITDVNSLVSAYSQVIDTYSLTWIDFDIEGYWLAEPNSVSRRNQAVALLQAKYPNLRVTYTLPVLSSGLTQDGINVVNGAKSAGVKLYCVNIMAMDYGGAVSDMAGAATSAAQATHNQTGLNIGITPMIGQNDSQGEIFSLNNANTVLTFANNTSYVTGLAFWSAGRDNGGCPGDTTASATCSGISQSDFQFTTTWESYSGGSGGCSPTPIVPYLEVNGGSWQQTDKVTINSGDSVTFGPQPVSGGSWSWSGPNGFSSTARQVTVSSITSSGNYTATYVNSCGSKSSDTFVVTVSSGGGGGLPSGWTDADIGSVGVAGSASYNNGTFTVSGSGADIWNTADAFNYAYQSVSGDQTIVARVVSENGGASYAKAGVMIRASTAANAAEVSVLLTPANGVAMEVRSTTGGSSVNVTGWITGVLPPQWVKLVRSGSTFTGYYSSNGSSWTQIASSSVTMNSGVIAGLAVTSHDNTSANTSTFDNVSISSGGPAPDFSLSASPNSVSVTQGSSGNSAISVTELNGFTGSVSLSASGLPGGVTASFNPSSTTTSSTLTLSASSTATTGTATVTITGTSGSLTHTTSVSLTVNAASGGGIDTTAKYQIQNEASGLVLNNQGSLTNGSKITQWNSVSSDNLRWTFIPTSGGYYQINSVKSGLDAVVQSASTSQGAGIIQWSFGAAGNDQWLPQSNSDGSYTFYNLHSGLVLEDPASSTNKTTQMDQWGANGGNNQKWKLLKQ